MISEVTFDAEVLLVYSPLDIEVKQQLQSRENANLYLIE